MSKRISVDTNVLLRYLMGDDMAQAELSSSLINSSSSIDVSDMVIIEMVEVQQRAPYGFDREHIAQNLEVILRNLKFNCNRNLFLDALSVYRERPKLSFVDICLALQADINEATPLITFDKKLANQMPQAKLLK